MVVVGIYLRLCVLITLAYIEGFRVNGAGSEVQKAGMEAYKLCFNPTPNPQKHIFQNPIEPNPQSLSPIIPEPSTPTPVC